MKNGKVLIVYYSRTGTTKKIAQALHREFGGELLEITTKHYHPGLRGYLTAFLDGALGRAVQITSKSTPRSASYDLVLVGTPVWGSAVAAPIRTYLAQSLPQSKHYAFFLTQSGSGASRVMGQLGRICGKPPVATLALSDSEIHHRKYKTKLEDFRVTLEGAGIRVPRAA